MAIERKDVEYVTNLAQLKLTPEEMDKFTSQLDQLVSYVNKLNQLDTSEVEPTFHVLDIYNVFREDEVKDSSDRDSILSSAPASEDGFFVVPKIIE